jgi:hypothetical protein
MRRKGIIGALLLIAVGVALGATVFRTDIAQATGLAQAVTVDNTTANPVPVREQNLDARGNINVHEQGTASVNVTNSSLAVHEQGTAAVHEQGTANVNVVSSSVPVSQAGAPVTIELNTDITYTVPAGKRFVIQYLNGGNAPSDPDTGLHVSGTVPLQVYQFVGTKSPATGNYLVSEPVAITVDPGNKLVMSNGGFLNVCGYLINA